jgi:hypothetical protein
MPYIGKQLTDIEDMLNDMNDRETVEEIITEHYSKKCLLCSCRMDSNHIVDEIIKWKNECVQIKMDNYEKDMRAFQGTFG